MILVARERHAETQSSKSRAGGLLSASAACNSLARFLGRPFRRRLVEIALPSVLIAGLSAGNTQAGLALVIGYRIVTVIGDVIATLAGFFIPINQTCVAPI